MKYLIVKTSSIGDIIHTFPVVAYLKHRDPSCTIDWVVEEEYAPLLKAYPDISHTLIIATRRWRRCFIEKKSFQELRRTLVSLRKKSYDVVFDLQGNTKSAFVTHRTKASTKVGFGWNSVPEWPNYFVTHKHFNVPQNGPIQHRYLSLVQQFFNDKASFESRGVELHLSPADEQQLTYLKTKDLPCIMVAFASKWNNKCLSFDTWLQFLKAVNTPKKCRFYFVSGTSQEKALADQLSAHFPSSHSLQGLSFPLWQRLMAEMDQVIAIDSAALALCGTTSTPSFSFFGPTQATVYKPMGLHHRHFQGSCPYQVSFSARCPKLRTCRTGACLKKADSSDLFNIYQEGAHSLKDGE